MTEAPEGRLRTWLDRADPHDPAVWMPRCPTKAVTGLDCPACGGLRVVHDLLTGDLRAAVRDNPFLVVCSPLLVGLIARALINRLRGRPTRVPPRLAYALGVAAMVWMAVRNLPAWPLKPTRMPRSSSSAS